MSTLQTMLLVFLFLGMLMVGCFFAYHCSLIAKGMTSYETFKWRDYKDHCIEMAQESRCACNAMPESCKAAVVQQMSEVNACTNAGYLSCIPFEQAVCLQANEVFQVLANMVTLE